MKILFTWLLGLSLLTIAESACSQDDRKLRNDPTYSTHNYKHANKAATARRWEANSGVVVQQPASTDASLANYKRQTPNQQPAGGITVNHTPSTNLASRNYKMQQPGRLVESAPENVAKKQKRKADTTAIGD